MNILPLLLLLPLLPLHFTSGISPTITLPSGIKIVGTTLSDDTTCNRYLSIPFAEPPIGSNRWAPPIDTKRSSGTIDGTKYPPLCMQPSDGWSSLDSSQMSEDCLYLNIYTPTTYEPQSLPVLVYIHGGDYLYGGTNDKELKGCNLVNVTKDVLVVTIQYRLGIFGFLGSDEMRKLDLQQGSTGNYGLLDQIQALKWIKKNIGVFGGNSGKVMIFGESAGAGSVTNLLVATGAKNLYHKAIMQSGAFADWTTKSLVNATAVFNDVVTRSKCNVNNDAISCLLKMDAKKLISLSNEITAYPDQWTVCRWSPTIDGIIIMDHPSEIVLRNPELINDVPIIYGNNDEEGASFLSSTTMSSSDWIPKNTWKYNDYQNWLKLNFPKHYELIEKEYKTMFNDNDNDDKALLPPRPWFVAQRIVGDFMLFCPGRRSAKALSNVDEPAIPRSSHVYEYMFDHVPIGNSENGAYHGAEIAFVFNDIKKSTNDEEYQLGQSMAWMWSMFAKYGNPTPSITNKPPPSMLDDLRKKNKYWLPFPTYVEIDTLNGGALELKKNLRSIYCEKVWDVIRVETPTESNNEHKKNGPKKSWTRTVSIAVGIGLTFTMLGIIFVCFLFFKYYYIKGNNTGSDENYTTFVDEGNSTGTGGVGFQEEVGEEEMNHIPLEVEDPNDIA
jgi:carboxylesterase type B